MNELLRRQLMASVLLEDKIEVGFRQVQDPYEPSEQLTVAVNIRSDLVEFFYNRGKINHAQFLAGRRFLFLVEKAEGSCFLVVDPAKEPVDCTGAAETIPAFRLDAAHELDEVRRYLGRRDYHLARRYFTGDAQAYPEPKTQRERDYQYRRLRDILEDLAVHWGYAGQKSG